MTLTQFHEAVVMMWLQYLFMDLSGNSKTGDFRLDAGKNLSLAHIMYNNSLKTLNTSLQKKIIMIIIYIMIIMYMMMIIYIMMIIYNGSRHQGCAYFIILAASQNENYNLFPLSWRRTHHHTPAMFAII